MAEVTAHERSEIDKEACAWIAQFDGAEPSEADMDAFREWVNRSPRHREAIERLSGLWGDLNVLTELAVPAPLQRTTSWGRFSMAVALSLILAASVIWWLPGSNDVITAPTAYATAVGEQRRIDLPDGSRVQLNTASRLEVAYSGDERELYLSAGEAFFDVAHDAKRPFLVHAGGRTVRAIGTAFSLRHSTGALDVLVTEGVVELSTEASAADGSSAQPRVLGTVERGQRVQLLQDVGDMTEEPEPQRVSDEEIARELAWREGMLSFSGEPLAVVIDEIGRYTRTRIIIEDDSLESLRIGGYFRAGDTDVMLDTLEEGFPIEVHRMADGSVRLRASQ